MLVSFFFVCLPCVFFFSEKKPSRVPAVPHSKAVPSRSGSAAWSSCFQSARSFDARLSQSEDVYEALAQPKKGGTFFGKFCLNQWQGEVNWRPVFFLNYMYENPAFIENGRILQGPLNYIPIFWAIKQYKCTPRKMNRPEPESLHPWKFGKSSEPNHHFQVRPVNLPGCMVFFL